MITIVHSKTAHYVVREEIPSTKVSPTDFFYALGELPPNHPLPVPVKYTHPTSFIVWYALALMKDIMRSWIKGGLDADTSSS